MILSIDPSYSSTGLLLLNDDGSLVSYAGIHAGGSVYKSNSDLNLSAEYICHQIKSFISEVTESITAVVEIPAPNVSGYYLAMLHGWIMAFLCSDVRVKKIVTLPPMACNSFCGNKTKSKSYIVDFAKSKGWIPNKRINNDIATASVLAHCYLAYLEGKYKNKVFIINR